MTREEAKDEIYSYVHMEDIDSVHEFMDILFDDIESRVCENCKYYNREYIGYCDNTYSLSTYHQITETTFGCNKFELESK